MNHTLNIQIANWREDADGFLRVTARILKEGVFPYSTKDLPEDVAKNFEGKQSIGEYIPAAEFTQTAIKTLEGKPIVIEKHEWRNVENNLVDGLTVGNVAGTPVVKENSIECDFIITDADTIQAVKSKKLVEVSASYLSDVEYIPGKFGQEEYGIVQRNLRFNHVLLLPAGKGRCGYDVRILNNKQESNTMFELRITNSIGQVKTYRFNDEKDMSEANKMVEDVRVENEAALTEKTKALETLKTQNAGELQAKDTEIETHKNKVSEIQVLLNAAQAKLDEFASEEYEESEAEIVNELDEKEKDETKKACENCKTQNERMKVVTTRVMNSRGVDLKDANDEVIKATFQALVASAKAKKPEVKLPKLGQKINNAGDFVHPVFRRQK